MTEDELIALIQASEDPIARDRLERWLTTACAHPSGTDLLRWPELVGLPFEATPEEIAHAALSWRPRCLAMELTHVRVPPRFPHLRALRLEARGVPPAHAACEGDPPWPVGSTLAVALHGLVLPDGTRVWRRLHGGAHPEEGVPVDARVLGPTGRAVGEEVPLDEACPG